MYIKFFFCQFYGIKLYVFIEVIFMPPHQMMPGAYSFFGYVRPPVRMCVCVYVCPVWLGLRHLYQVESELLRAHIFQTMIHVHLVHIWSDDSYRSKVLFSNTHTHAHDLKVKVMDLEIFNVKDSG